MSRIVELRERRRSLYEEARTQLDEAERDNRDLAGEDLAAWEARMAEVDRLGREIDAREKDEATRKKLEVAQPEPDLNGHRNGNGQHEQRKPPPGVTPYEVAFRSYLRQGRLGMEPSQVRILAEGLVPLSSEQRALGVGTTTAGGFTVPQGFLTDLVTRMKAYGAVRRVARVISTDSGADMPFPRMDDTANVGRILAENVALTQTDVAFTSATLKAYMYSSDLVLVSYQLLQDSAFNIDQELRDALGERLGRIMNQHFTTGTGTAQPQGVITGGTVGVTTAAGQLTSITYDDLVNLIHSVDPAYRQSGAARFMMGDTALSGLRKLKDTTGQPLWQPSLQNGVPDNLLGYPVEINPDMAAPAANAKSAAFGDFGTGYLIRDVRGVQMVRLDERYADNLQVGFFGFARADGIVRDVNAYRVLVHPAA